MADEKINDFLLDQELEPDDLALDGDLPDDIDAILDAVEEEEFKSVAVGNLATESMEFSDDLNPFDESILIEEKAPRVTEKDLKKGINLATEILAMPDSIPLISDVIDPKKEKSRGKGGAAGMDDELMSRIMAKVQAAVEQAVQQEVGRLAGTLTESIVEDVKERLPALLSGVLKGK